MVRDISEILSHAETNDSGTHPVVLRLIDNAFTDKQVETLPAP